MKILNIKKTLNALSLVGLISITLIECKKDKLEEVSITEPKPVTKLHNTPPTNFCTSNEGGLVADTIDGTADTTFASPQVTTVIAPPGAFVIANDTLVSAKEK